MTPPGQSVTRLRWRRRDEREYEAGDYTIAPRASRGRASARCCWHLRDGFKLLGIYGTLREAKAAADQDRFKELKR